MTRADWRLAVLFLHVLGAVVALGFSLSYGLWIGRGDATGGERRAFALQTVSWIDRRLTTPAYILQAVTGVILVLLVDLDLFRRLEVSIGIYVLLTVLAITVYAPAHRRADGPRRAPRRRGSRRDGVRGRIGTGTHVEDRRHRPDGDDPGAHGLEARTPELTPRPPLTGGRIATSSPSATGVSRSARSPFTTNEDTPAICAKRSP